MRPQASFDVVGYRAFSESSVPGGAGTVMSIPLPTGTELGDMIVVGGTPANTDGNIGYLGDDARLGFGRPMFGIASNLAPVTLKKTGAYACSIVIVTLRNVVGVPTQTVIHGGNRGNEYGAGRLRSRLYTAGNPAHTSGLAFVTDWHSSLVVVGESPTWSTVGSGIFGAGSSVFITKVFAHVGPLPNLDVAFGPGPMYNRRAMLLLFSEPQQVTGDVPTQRSSFSDAIVGSR